MINEQISTAKLPHVKGSNLQRKKMSFPADFAGELNLVFIAFLRRHQDVIDSWVPFVDQLAYETPHLEYYEFPTLPRSGPVYRWFVNEGMRAGIPNNATRARTITLYIDKGAFRDALGIEGEREMWIYVFDQEGNVLWRVDGAFSAEKAASLKEFVQGYAGE